MSLFDYFQTYYLDRNFGPGYVATNVSYVIAVVLLLNDVQWDDRRALLKKAGEMFLCWLGTLAFCSVYNMLLGHDWMDRLMMLLFMACYAIFRSKYSARTRVVRGCVFFTCTTLSMPVSEPIGELFEEINADYTWAEHLTSLVMVILLLFALVFLRSFSTERQVFAPVFPTVLVGVISGLGLMLVYVSEVMSVSQDYRAFNVLLAGSFWVLELVTYYLYYRMTQEYGKNLELMAIAQKEELEQELLQISQQNYEELHEIRHEMKNHLLYIRVLAENGEDTRLLNYLSMVTEETEELFSFVECGNDVINAVMNHAWRRAQAAGVTLESQIVVPPQLPYRETDLCSLLSNLMDNAIEAAAQSGAEPPVVTVGIRPVQDYLFLRVTNPVNDSVSRRRRLSLRTIKENERAHGYGTKIIRNIALRYQGSVKFDMQGNSFVADVMLSLAEEEQDGKAVAGNL